MNEILTDLMEQNATMLNLIEQLANHAFKQPATPEQRAAFYYQIGLVEGGLKQTSALISGLTAKING
jgi:hypothetical protein